MMTSGMRKRIIVYGTILIIVGIIALAWWHYLRVERAYANAFLLSSLGQINLCARTLQMIEEDRLDTAKALLDMYLDSSVQSALEMHSSGGRLYSTAVPSMKDGLKRAAQELRARGNENLAIKAEKLLQALEVK